MADAVAVARPPLSKVSLIFACGTALFSDGYANNVIGLVVTVLKAQYGNNVITTHQSTILSSLTFAGTVLGMLVFGYMSDKIGRKFGMMLATGIVAVFSLLSACAKGAGGSINGLVAALSAYRFLLGIGIGAEYPCGSVAASEQSEEKGISKNAQHRWFALATNSMIDFGFVIGAFVPLVLFWIFGEHHLNAVWRGSLGLGIIPAVAVFIWRLRMEEPTRFKKDSMKNATIPYMLIIRRYWTRLAAVCITWFIYDFITYPFGLYTSTIVDTVEPTGASLAVVFGWSVVINLFYMPGTLVGAFAVDWLGPKYTMITGLLLQALFGFIMSGLYTRLKHHIAGFAVIYGLFLTFGEFGPGNCLGLIAAKSGPTAVRGQFYGVAAAVGKVGAFVGTWAFPPMINAFGGADSDRGNSGPFFVGSGLAIFSALITFAFIRPLTADGMAREDAEFREYLVAHGYDVTQMGIPDDDSSTYSSTDDVKDRAILNEKAV
ncbi:MFS Git1p-related glycerophosphoinositol and glycerophosphocholine permease [Ramaria rubella]|nr:MFS Git1p-related glycerophosphoinositol and glycerophosphocholine permease [Ramaria rubella]